jgi:tubulin-specific chaperone D
VDSFLDYVTNHKDDYLEPAEWTKLDASPLPRIVCRLLYILCKVRGLKVIIRFLNNEPKYIEPMLTCFVHWKLAKDASGASTMIWEERYIMLIWLSHLTLTPFDLASVSSMLLVEGDSFARNLRNRLPNIAISLLSLAWNALGEPSKEREAAGMLIVRLSLRPDMQRQGLLEGIINHTMSELGQAAKNSSVSVYKDLGLLSILAGFVVRGSNDDVSQIVVRVFRFCFATATSDSSQSLIIRNSAPARKLLIKTMRSSLLHALSLSETHSESFTDEMVDPMIEDTISYLLESLADKDTPVRLAASKALSIVTLKLEATMAGEVVQAVVDSFGENLLYEQPGSIELVALRDLDPQRANMFRPHFGAVDPLRWHGLMLSLGHLLFRRSPPPLQLPLIIRTLLLGLTFEQRSNVGTSLGVGVRDAACFGVWAMSRKYTTAELNAVDVSEVQQASIDRISTEVSNNVVQLLATQLVVSACLDPSGNIRRGASAALQEMVGRHPDTVEEGIALVQIVDYNAVGRHSRAMTEVAIKAAALAENYYLAFLSALFDWRGSRAADANSRRAAANAVGQLSQSTSHDILSVIYTTAVDQLKKLKHANTGTNAEARHGLLLTLAAAIDNCKRIDKMQSTLLSLWGDLRDLVGDLTGRVTRELELAFEATSVLLSSLARISHIYLSNKRILSDITGTKGLFNVVEILERCQAGSEKDEIVEAAARAASNLFSICSRDEKTAILKRWLDEKHSKHQEYKCKGRIISLTAIFEQAPESTDNLSEEGQGFQSQILARLQDFILGTWPIETKISAVISLSSILRHLRPGQGGLEPMLTAALTDYTIDQRGDVGSNLRLEGIKATNTLITLNQESKFFASRVNRPMQEVAKQAAEKLDKIRFQAWLCLEEYWQKQEGFPALARTYSHLADVSSTAYYKQLLELLEVDWLRAPIIGGIVSSAAAGSELLGIASRGAIVAYIQEQDGEVQLDVYMMFLTVLIKQLRASASEDRVAIPTMELLAFLIEQTTSNARHSEAQHQYLELLEVMEMIHGPSSSLPRVEAAMHIYSSLVTVPETGTRALDRLTRLLLHRYPKVRTLVFARPPYGSWTDMNVQIRNTAADTLFFHVSPEDMITCNWARPTAELKPAVRTLRKSLKVV